MKTEYYEYGHTIDTVEDLLESEQKLLVAGDTFIKNYLESDPRSDIMRLYMKGKIAYYTMGNEVRDWVTRG